MKKWLTDRFLPMWAKETVLADNRRLQRESAEQKRKIRELEAYIEDNMILYRLTDRAKTRRARESDLPPTGLFR